LFSNNLDEIAAWHERKHLLPKKRQKVRKPAKVAKPKAWIKAQQQGLNQSLSFQAFSSEKIYYLRIKRQPNAGRKATKVSNPLSCLLKVTLSVKGVKN